MRSIASLEGEELEERTEGDEIVLYQMPSLEQGVVLCWDPWMRMRVEL